MSAKTIITKPTKRNSRIISGQLWVFRTDRYWNPNRGGGYQDSAIIATRISDGRTVTGSSRERLERCIEWRIAEGTY